MVRENITQRDTDFHDTREGIVLARNWLKSKVTTVELFNNRAIGSGDKGQFVGSEPDSTSYRSISNFIQYIFTYKFRFNNG